MQFSVAEIKAKADKALLAHKNIPDGLYITHSFTIFLRCISHIIFFNFSSCIASLAEARQIFLGEIFDWSDYYGENLSETPTTEEAIQTFDAIVNLWIEYARFEVGLRQYKKAVEVFDNALNDSLVSTSAKIYLAYAEFCTERNKNSNAQKVFIKGLCAGLSPGDSANLWNQFLALMHKVNNAADLTLSALYTAVKQQVTDASTLAAIPNEEKAVHESPAPVSGVPTVSVKIEENGEVNTAVSAAGANNAAAALNTISSAAESKVDDAFIVDNNRTSTSSTSSSSSGSSHMPSDNAAAAAAATESSSATTTKDIAPQDGGGGGGQERQQQNCIDDLDAVTGLTPEQVILLHAQRPQMIFSAPSREPMSLGLRTLRLLSPDDTAAVQNYFKCTMQELITCCLAGGNSKSSDKNGEEGITGANTTSILEKTLDILESLWYAQALKERHFDAWMSDLRQLHANEEREITLTAEGTENKLFRNRCVVQRELLNAVINKTLTALLLEQQQVLADAGLPMFTKDFVTNLENDQRTRQNSLPGAVKVKLEGGTSASAAVMDRKDINSRLSAQRGFVCALLSTRLSTSGPVTVISTPALLASTQPMLPPPQGSVVTTANAQSTSIPSNLALAQPLLPVTGTNNTDLVSNLASSSEDAFDYYSQEAKNNRRKKRRRLVDSSGQDVGGSFDQATPDKMSGSGGDSYGSSLSPVSPGSGYGPVSAPSSPTDLVTNGIASFHPNSAIYHKGDGGDGGSTGTGSENSGSKTEEQQNALLLQIAAMLEQQTNCK